MADFSQFGMVQVFWGNGKGKTTSALGTALRACGNGFSVHLVQFMKNGVGNKEIDFPGELRALEKFPNFTFKRFGLGEWFVKGKNEPAHKKSVEETYNYLVSCFQQDYNIIIADEILYAVQLGLLDEHQVLELIDKKPKNMELILTGSHLPLPTIFEKADLVTEIKKIKHPYDRGILARMGLEY